MKECKATKSFTSFINVRPLMQNDEDFRKLPSLTKIVYLSILSMPNPKNDFVMVKRKTLAKWSNCSVKSVQRALTELKEHNYIVYDPGVGRECTKIEIIHKDHLVSSKKRAEWTKKQENKTESLLRVDTDVHTIYRTNNNNTNTNNIHNKNDKSIDEKKSNNQNDKSVVVNIDGRKYFEDTFESRINADNLKPILDNINVSPDELPEIADEYAIKFDENPPEKRTILLFKLQNRVSGTSRSPAPPETNEDRSQPETENDYEETQTQQPENNISNIKFLRWMEKIRITSPEIQSIQNKINIDLDKYLECIIHDYNKGGINNVVGWLIRAVDGSYNYPEDHPVLMKKQRDKAIDEGIKQQQEQFKQDRIDHDNRKQVEDDILENMTNEDRERIRQELIEESKEKKCKFIPDVLIEKHYIDECTQGQTLQQAV